MGNVVARENLGPIKLTYIPLRASAPTWAGSCNSVYTVVRCLAVGGT